MNEREARSLVARCLMVGFSGTEAPSYVEELIRDGVRSFILFRRNVEDVEGVRRLTNRLQELCDGQAVIAIDHEGGLVNRLRHVGSEWPSAMAHAATGDPELAFQAYRAAAAELASIGITINFAPVCDVLGDYRNPVLGTRTFSDDPATASRFVTAAVRGYAAGGVASTAKHFPGHGFTPVDSHLDLPVVARTAEELESADLVPFRAAAEAGVDALMISHVWYSVLDPASTPATLSSAVMSMARGLPFDGPIFTDCMEMDAVQRSYGTGEAVVTSLGAGCDVVIVSHREDRQREALDALSRAIQDGRIPVRRAEEAAARCGRLATDRAASRTAEGIGGGKLAKQVAEGAVTLVRDRGVLPLRPDQELPVLTFETRYSPAVGPEVEASGLVQALAAQGIAAQEVSIPRDAVAAMERIGAVPPGTIVLAQTAFAVGDEVQGRVLEEVRRRGCRVVLVARRDPFDLLACPDAEAYVVMYDDVGPSAEAAAAVLAGKARARGHLPVDIPGQYPRGHGESGPAGVR